LNRRIDHTNYEAWLLDRQEGDLTPEQEKELDLFLILHPELAPMDDALPRIAGGGNVLNAMDKEALKRELPPAGIIDSMNVEDHLIARLEGDLDDAKAVALKRYLMDHPALSRSERSLELTKVDRGAMEFDGKGALRRQLPPASVLTTFTAEDHLIAHVEGDLTQEQERVLEAWLMEHPAAQHDLHLFKSSRIAAAAVVYEAKEDLKKEVRVIPIGAARWAVRLAVAASITALIGSSAWFLFNRERVGTEVAKVDEVRPPVPEDREDRVQEPTPRSVQEITTEHKIAEDQKTDVQPSAPKPERSFIPAPKSRPNEPLLVEEPEEKGDIRPEQATPVIHNEPEPLLVATTTEKITPKEPMEHFTTVGGLIASTIRGKVLDAPTRDTRPLDDDDAVAVVDRGLKAVAGTGAGLSIGRNAEGGIGSFHLRFGRRLAISASR